MSHPNGTSPGVWRDVIAAAEASWFYCGSVPQAVRNVLLDWNVPRNEWETYQAEACAYVSLLVRDTPSTKKAARYYAKSLSR